MPKSRGEVIRRTLRERQLLRSDLDILDEGDSLIFPVAGTVSPDVPGTPVERDFPQLSSGPPRSYRELVAWPDEARARLPRAFDVIGDIVLIRLPASLLPRAADVGEALLRFVPGARIVGLDGGVHGVERRRALTKLAGNGGWRTTHAENGLTFEVDVSAAYFSPRLSREHLRVAALCEPGEAVLDLCCGIGPFALTIARTRPVAGVVAVDLNPEAIALVEANARRLGVGERLRAVCASLDEFLPSAGTFSRVVLNLPHEGIKYLTSVGSVVAPRGSLHYYEVTERASSAGRPETILHLLPPGTGPWSLRSRRVVHPYSPRSDIVVYDLFRGPTN
ncbi:MAG: methyltransferase domain-containing protein [Thermoplasmata archaeon]